MADNFKCTPNTRLRKDRELFGELASKYTFSTANQGTGKVKAVTFKSASSLTLNEVPKVQDKNFSAFHKKQGLNSLQDEKGRLKSRLEFDKQRQKNRRSELLMDRRKVRDITPPTDLTSVPFLQTKNGNLKMNGNADNRKERLQKWREEKQAAATTAVNKKTIGAASKAGPARPNPVPVRAGPGRSGIPQKQAVGQAIPQPNQRVPYAPKKPPPVTTANIRGAAAGDAKPGERRVTRAMVKAQTTGPAPVSMQPAITKMKNLTLAPKSVAPAAMPKVKNVNSQDKGQPQKVVTFGKASSKVPSRDQVAEDSVKSLESPPTVNASPQSAGEPEILNEPQGSTPVEAPPAAAEAPPKAKAKKKIMGIDSVFVEFNQKLSEASTSLMTTWKHWEELKKQEDDSIPEETLGDIESTQGQAKLLMDSKLPQFAQLLYFYLSKEENPGPVLPCDLQGWWDVAALQIERVIARFASLSNLEKNGWRPPTPPLTEVKSSEPMPKSDRASEPSQSKPKSTKAKAQASSGLRAFLASQRKNKNPNGASEEEEKKESAKPVPTPPPRPATPPKSSSPIRQFEGGFFSIASPLRSSNKIAPSPRIEALKSSSKAPLGRRSSIGSNASLVMLRVRNSMGPMCKIGANTEHQDPETPKSVVEYTRAESDGFPTGSLVQKISSSDQGVNPRSILCQSGEKISKCDCEDECKETDHEIIHLFSASKSHQGAYQRSASTHEDDDARPGTKCITEARKVSKKSRKSRRKKLEPTSKHFVTLKVKSKCIFSRSFHHFMDRVKSDDLRSSKRVRKHRKRRRANGVNVQLLPHNNTSKSAENSSEESPADTRKCPQECPEAPPRCSQDPDRKVESLPLEDTEATLDATTELSKSWSPFYYKQMHLFDDNQLRQQLTSLYPDWIQEFTIDLQIDTDTRRGLNDNSKRTDPFISFSRGDVDPEPATYCQIFGAQNSFDSHPEYSPFNDNSMCVIESLVAKHCGDPEENSRVDSSLPTFQTSDDNRTNFVWNPRDWEPPFNVDLVEEIKPSEISWAAAVAPNPQRELKKSEDEDRSEMHETCFIEKQKVVAVKCKICDIYQRMQKRRTKSSERNVTGATAECTHCGRVADVTPIRRSMRHGLAQNLLPPTTEMES